MFSIKERDLLPVLPPICTHFHSVPSLNVLPKPIPLSLMERVQEEGGIAIPKPLNIPFPHDYIMQFKIVIRTRNLPVPSSVTTEGQHGRAIPTLLPR